MMNRLFQRVTITASSSIRPIVRRSGECRRSLAATSKNVAPTPSLRRRRTGFTTVPETPLAREPQQLLGLSQAYRPHEENVDDYLAKTTLSPWVPLPDAACRALLDLVQLQATDRHVDLGSGDGRVNFWAADYAKVEWTLGVDVDPGILQVARNRLAKRHPRPDNIEFWQADLLSSPDLDDRDDNDDNDDNGNKDVWDRIRQATVLTMYFATPALRLFRPVLEERLRGHSCKIVTAGYPMPGWHAFQTTVVLGTTLHYYRWGDAWEDEDNDNDNDDDEADVFLADDLILPEAAKPNALETDRFRGANIIDRTTGENLRKLQMEQLKSQESESHDPFDDDDDDDDDEDDEEDDAETGDDKPPKVKVEKVQSPQS